MSPKKQTIEMRHWQNREMMLGDFVQLQRGHDLTEADRKAGHIPVMGSAGSNGYHNTALARGPGVVVGRSGASFGQVHYCSSDYWPHNTVLYVTDFRGNDRRFTYYLLKSIDFTRYNSGSAQASLNRNYIYPITVCVPKPAVQRAIAAVLGALDDKIELNRRMNETLGATARTIFQNWFVDATQAGLPQGWRASTIRELASKIQYGLTQSASTEPVGPRFLRITDIQGGRVDWGSVPFCKVSPEEHERYRLKAGDVLVARTGASTGENIYLPVVADAVFASYLVRFQFDDPAMARLVGAFMRTPAYLEFVAGCIGGSAQPNASAQVLAGAVLPVPPTEIAKRFADTVAPFDRRMAANNEESCTLAALRDALLPKLLSGELRVKDAAKVVEACA